MVNDVGGEDSDADAVGHFLRFPLDFDVESEDDGPLGVALQHRRRLHDVTLVHGADADTLVRGKGETRFIMTASHGSRKPV